MGFRSTFCSTDYPIKWPDWFREKYKNDVCFNGALHSMHERKLHGSWLDLPEDIRKAINWDEWEPVLTQPFRFVILFLHECGGVTRCEIRRDGVFWSEPDEWVKTMGSTHSYCYGCSNHDNAIEGVS